MRITISLLRWRLHVRCARRFATILAVALAPIAFSQTRCLAQGGNIAPANNPPAAVFPGVGPQNVLLGGPQGNVGGAQPGGSANADFESLIDLITSTIHPEMWADNGGVGDVRPFPGGVLVDAAGTLRLRDRSTNSNALARLRAHAPREETTSPAATGEVRQASALRFVSLPRLEREIARRQSANEPLDPAMLTLAGLQRVQYVFAYPETGDLVLAGPAGDWQMNREGRLVSAATGLPVVRLDDLITLLRRERAGRSFFGCSISPRQEALARTQVFLASTSSKPLQPGRREEWLSDVRDAVGMQEIEVFGIDPASRVASVLIEADYHMKLIGMGLVEGVDGVESYLASIELAAGESPPAMTVLRWWFTLNYKEVATTADGLAYELTGQGVRLLSENELLADRGVRIHTHNSDRLNQKFADAFTLHFDEIAKKYAVYAELRNLFELAMAVAIIYGDGLAERAGWIPGVFVDADRLPLPQGRVPRHVETVINHRVIDRKHIVAGVSGGVMAAPRDVLGDIHMVVDGELNHVSANGMPAVGAITWWWDLDK